MKRLLLLLLLLNSPSAFAVNVTNEPDLQACYLNATLDYTVTANITVTADFVSYMINAYTGTFDGGNYTIDSFTLTPAADYFGLFKSVNGGTVKNIIMTNISIAAHAATIDYGSPICGYLYGGGTITNCHTNSGTFNSNGSRDGGICGFANNGTISNCTSGITMTGGGASAYGGIVGYIYAGSNVNNCSYSGTMDESGRNYAGGIVGCMYNSGAASSVTYCSSNGDITGGDTSGGIIGRADAGMTITNNSFTGSMSGGTNTGGIVGDCYSSISNCQMNGATVIHSNLYRVGGIVGNITGGTVSDCTVTNGTVGQLSRERSGGIAGQTNSGSTLTNCHVVGTSILGSGRMGGLVGYNYKGNITECSATNMTFSSNGADVGGVIGELVAGTITKTWTNNTVLPSTSNARDYYGGFVGYHNGTTALIDNCFCTGDVGSSDLKARTYVGGFAGYAMGPIRRSYATGNVWFASRGGGFVGQTGNNAADIDDCFCTGTVGTGSTMNGMFCGYNYLGTISNCGCLDDATIRDIGNPAGDVTYAVSDPPATWIGNTSHNLFDTGTYLWYFAPAVKTVTLGSGGAGYTVNDVLTITQAGSLVGATVTATTVVGGAVTAISLTKVGQEYAVENGLATTGGTGTGCTVNITAIDDPVWYVHYRNYPRLEQRTRVI